MGGASGRQDETAAIGSLLAERYGIAGTITPLPASTTSTTGSRRRTARATC